MFDAVTVKAPKPFSKAVGRRLGEDLVNRLGGTPNACWLFSAPDGAVNGLLRGIHEAVATDSIVGCTTDGEVSSAGFGTDTAVLAGVVTDRIDFHVASVKGLGPNSQDAGRRIAEKLPRDVSYVQIFSDGLTGNGCAILRGIASVMGAEVPIAGGTAGDAGRFERTRQYHGNRVLSDAVVAVGFSGNFKVGTGVRSGWSPVGTVKIVTRARENVVYELNGEPALDVFTRFLGKHADKLPAVGVEYPLGIVGKAAGPDEEDYDLIRATMSVNREDGSLSFAGEIPEGAAVRLTCGDNDSILKGTEEAARLALMDLGEIRPRMAFFYSCMARKIVLGRRTGEEMEVLHRTVGKGLPVIGFYTYGEYCRVRCGGPSLLHNETATVSVIGV
ncbi:MAG: FIST N-terminal domain-containing protein [Desulfomonilaceae bacterium]|nr:FIST N-terminal domain-containing protein [Desulfomonilaceae bacterium]